MLSWRFRWVLEIIAVFLLMCCLAYLLDRGLLFFAYGGGESVAILAGLTSFFGTMLGFVIAIISFLFVSAEKKDFEIFRASASYCAHWAIFKGALYSCFLATVLCLSGLVAAWFSLLHKLHGVAIVGAATWVVLRLVLVVWVVKEMIDAEVRLGENSREKI